MAKRIGSSCSVCVADCIIFSVIRLRVPFKGVTLFIIITEGLINLYPIFIGLGQAHKLPGIGDRLYDHLTWSECFIVESIVLFNSGW